ncbi:copper homeostasis periplasmic binding protein CopC [Budviciaceae bacterium CWB-B4]|uniref:Copper resistance protein C n=1 Tax=Limnobaculum xujianqingii TaxID=2738837 RepID=A0A9D7FWU3_9GAMM|nr:copper homeostasis periplasmic binding protein CopC [Limnobaculum xujianqingii]MBK5072377.1 copper homeostasis periplasmic binding protein CopC [Limnobaculum xujianqingii]MBK5175686.1 copper homeostasis periplasmic binding protein CopC [Limnobaculum xujianqingii]
MYLRLPHLLASLLVILFGLTSPLVLAHAHLKQQMPAAESILTTSPEEISLKYSEGIEVKFSKIELLDPNNKVIPTDNLLLDATDNTRMIAPLKASLPVGQYTVNWHVVSVDGHKTKGKFQFIVKPD